MMSTNKQSNLRRLFRCCELSLLKWGLLSLMSAVSGLHGSVQMVSDGFERVNTGKVEVEMQPNPIGSSYHIVEGAWEIVGGHALQASSGGLMYDSRTRVERGEHCEYRLSMRVLHPNHTMEQSPRYAGIVLNYQNKDDYYLIRWSNESDGQRGRIQVIRQKSGQSEILDSVEGLELPGHEYYQWIVASTAGNPGEVSYTVSKPGVREVIHRGVFMVPELTGYVGFYRSGSGTVRFDDYQLVVASEPLSSMNLSLSGEDGNEEAMVAGFELKGHSPFVRNPVIDHEARTVHAEVFPGVPFEELNPVLHLAENVSIKLSPFSGRGLSDLYWEKPFSYILERNGIEEEWLVEVREALPAFPGAMGAGRYSKGGRGGDVFHVTSLECEGPGTFREGIKTAEGPRTIVFDIGGTIDLKKLLYIDRSNLTIAGQTAPGDGITIRTNHPNRGLYFVWELLEPGVAIPFPEDVIIQHVRVGHHTEALDDGFRVSPNTTPGTGPRTPFRDSGGHGMRIDDAKNVILDHVSVRFGARNNLNMRGAENNTLQYVFNMEPTGRKFGGWLGGGVASEIYTLNIHHYGRPFRALNGHYEMMNNVTYNVATRGQGPGNSYAYMLDNTKVNLVGNVFIDGPGPGPDGIWPVDHMRPSFPPQNAFEFELNTNAYVQGNYWDKGYDYSRMPGDQAPLRLENADAQVYRESKDRLSAVAMNVMWPSQRLEPVSARQAYINVLSWGGASASRDQHDLRVVREVINKAGAWRNLPKDIPGGAFPQLDSGEPVVSTARDGIADWWKEQHGLDINRAYHQEYTDSGYTYLEKYLHSLTARTFPPREDETEIVEIPSNTARGGVAVVGRTGRGRVRNGNGQLWIGDDAGKTQYLLVRFDMSSVEAGRILDGHLRMTVAGTKAGASEFEVYGLGYENNELVWDPARVTMDHFPLEVAGDTLVPSHENWFRLGRIASQGGSARESVIMDNPNLPVYLNLGSYYPKHANTDLVTLLLVPRKGQLLIPDPGAEAYDITLVLDAIAAEF